MLRRRGHDRRLLVAKGVEIDPDPMTDLHCKKCPAAGSAAGFLVRGEQSGQMLAAFGQGYVANIPSETCPAPYCLGPNYDAYGPLLQHPRRG
ncbi:hypothetical protein ACVWXO_008760 [Bradyrhizobium sp. LM2.7]